MPRSRQLTQMLGDVRSESDQVNSTFCSDAELTEWINQGWAEFYDFLVMSGELYYLTSATVAITSGNASYGLPDDYYKTRGVDVLVSGSVSAGNERYENAKRYNFEERNDYDVSSWAWPSCVYYDIRGGNLHFIPKPASANTVIHHYYPYAARLVNGTDAVDGINGHERYAIVYAVILAKKKEESDVSVELAQLEALKNRALSTIKTRDLGSAPRVRQSRRQQRNSPLMNGRRWP
jgi:hypothetical protein